MDIFWYKKGSVQQIHHTHLKNNLHKILREHDKIWIDMPEFGPEEEELLRMFFGIHPLTIEDCSKTTSRPKLEEFDTYVYIVLYGLDSQGKFIQLNYILGEDYLITIQRERIQSHESLKKDQNKLSELLSRDTEFVMHHVIDVEVDKYFPIIEHFDMNIEQLETRVMTDTSRNIAQSIFTLKHQLLTLKHHVNPQKDVLFMLSRKGIKFMMASAVDYFRDVYDHTQHALEDIENYREILNSTLDVHLSVMSNHMNDVIKVLTVVSTIMMPLTLIASIYGMNFDNLPELHWQNGYYIVLCFMVLLAAVMYVYFKKKKWM